MKNNGILIIFLVFLLVLIIVPPFFNFPLNDDWAYGKSVKAFEETKEIKLSDWTAASFIFQLFWGYAFALPLGFSFTALRISTLVLAFAGLASFYLAMKEFKFSEKICVLATLLLLFNPLFFNLSYTFMTDIPFISLVLLSALFFIKYIKKQNIGWLFFASIFSTASVLIRQNGVLVPIAFLLFILIKKFIEDRKSKAKNMSGAKKNHEFYKIILLALPFIALVLFELWYKYIHGTGIKYQQSAIGLIYIINPIKIAGFLLISAFCISFYLLPLVLLFIANIKKILDSKKQVYVFFISMFFYTAFLAVYLLLLKDFPFFGYQGFIVSKHGIGPATMAGEKSLMFPFYVSLILGVLAAINLSFITCLFSGKLRKLIEKTGTKSKTEKNKILEGIKADSFLFVWIIILLQLAFILLKSSIFDRYLLILFPFFIILLISKAKEFRYLKAGLLILVLASAIFSFAGTREYIEWNKARWKAVKTLFGSNISPEEIDGGFEFNGWYTYEYALANLSMENNLENSEAGGKEDGILDYILIKSFSNAKSHPSKPNAISWWFVVDDEYIIAFSEIKEYETINKVEYFSLLHAEKQYIYVLRRI